MELLERLPTHEHAPRPRTAAAHGTAGAHAVQGEVGSKAAAAEAAEEEAAEEAAAEDEDVCTVCLEELLPAGTSARAAATSGRRGRGRG